MSRTMMENENKNFTNISNFSETMFADCDICDHDLMKDINMIV